MRAMREMPYHMGITLKIYPSARSKRLVAVNDGARRFVYNRLVAEDLKVKNLLKNHYLAKSISDVSWSSFFTMLDYKSTVYGKTFVKVSPNYTTQTCSECGYVMQGEEHLDLSASYNIGARYFIREIIKSLPKTERLDIEAKVPGCSRRSTCTLSTLISLNAELMPLSA